LQLCQIYEVYTLWPQCVGLGMLVSMYLYVDG
jgi:hypothetical protein